MSYVEPSICIPRVFANIGWKRIKSTLEEAGWGTVAHVDMIMKTSPDGQEYKRVFVHFNEWKDTDVQADLMADKEVTLTYNDPWFWKITKSRAAVPSAPGATGAPTGGKPRSAATGAGRSTATGTSVAALEQTVRMQAQQLQLLTSLMLQQSGMGAMVPIPATPSAAAPFAPHKKPYKTAPAAAPTAAPMLGDGKYKEKRNYRTPAKRLDFTPASAVATPASVATPEVETVAPATSAAMPTAPSAPKKLQLRRKLEDADDADAE
jgi:hypothetical protein